MKRPKEEAERWIAQSQSDLGFAELGAREGYHAQACFMAQQTAEKALKAVHYLGGARLVFGHSVVELLAALSSRHPGLAELRDGARQLDQYYVPTRYPNGLPGGVPSDVFSRNQAIHAVALARAFVERARAIITNA
jgi:HEPN domain-containing protein